MKNIDKYKEIFCQTFDVDEDRLDETFTFDDVDEWDSLGHMTLVSALEDAFDIFLETDEILNFGSFENGKKILQNHEVKLEDDYEG